MSEQKHTHTPGESSEGACCACVRVRYAPEEVGGGLVRDRWACQTCGSEFARAAVLKARVAELEAANAKLGEALRGVKRYQNWTRDYGPVLEPDGDLMYAEDVLDALALCEGKKTETCRCNAPPEHSDWSGAHRRWVCRECGGTFVKDTDIAERKETENHD